MPLGPTADYDPVLELENQAQRGRAHILEHSVSILRGAQYDPIHQSVEPTYQILRARPDTEKSPIETSFQGALGVYLFSYHAQNSNDIADHTALPTADIQRTQHNHLDVSQIASSEAEVEPTAQKEAHQNQFLEDPHTRAFLYDLYRLTQPMFRDDNVTLYATGTTSFILHLQTIDFILKIVKPWYLENTLIASQTKSYKELYCKYLQPTIPNHTPLVRESTDRSIIMKRVRGRTLRDYFSDPKWDNVISDQRLPDYLRELRRVVTQLCHVLQLSSSFPHGDLSSRNIIREEPGGNLFLIDFGINYLLVDRVGSTDEYRETVYTVAPDILNRRGRASPTNMGDVYSIGVMLVEGLLRDEFDPSDLDESLDKVYRRYQGLGGVLDDLLDLNWKRRLLGLQDADSSMYRELGHMLRVELEVAANVAELESDPRMRTFSAVLGALLTPELKEFWKLRYSQRQRKQIIEEEYGVSDRVQPIPFDLIAGRLGLFPILLNGLVILLVVGKVIDWSSIARGEWAISPALYDNWMGWLVALSCSIVGAKYFVSIFFGLDPGGLSKQAWVTTHLCAFAPWIPILWVVLYRSNDWPVCAALGVSIIVWNNIAWYRLTGDGLSVMNRNNLRTSPDMESAHQSLFEWWFTAGVYVAFIYLVAWLLARGLVKDEFLYAIAVAVAANGKMYFINAGRDAARMHNGLDRITRGFRRALVPLAGGGG
jgi:serine/threonine protein kinase